MLEEIILSNQELVKQKSIIPILKQMESFIPENARENFYTNLKTLTFAFSEKEKETCYLFKENKITINTDFKPFFLGEWTEDVQEEEAKRIFLTTLSHELFHMASTKYNKEIDLVQSGFEVAMPNKTVLNMYLNEGFTEMLNECLYPDAFLFSGYKDTVAIANFLTNIVGIDFIKQLYFTNGLAIQLENAMSTFVSKNIMESLFTRISSLYYFKVANKTEEYRNTLHEIVFHDLQTILMSALSYSIQNGAFQSKEEIANFYKEHLQFSIDNLIDILKQNEMDASLLNEEALHYLDFVDNYQMYFPEDLKATSKLGMISIRILLIFLSLLTLFFFIFYQGH